MQSSRFFHGIKKLKEAFPTIHIQWEYKIPKLIFLRSVLKYFFIAPLLLSTYILINLYIRNFRYSRPTHHSRYEVVSSSKNVVSYIG